MQAVATLRTLPDFQGDIATGTGKRMRY